MTGHADALFGPDGVTARQSGFTRDDLTRALLERLEPGTVIDHQRTESTVDRLLKDPRVLPLLTGGSDSDRRYTTVELAGAEQRTLDLATTPTFIPTSDAVVAMDLSFFQRRTLQAIAASPATVDVVIGSAGAGKTTMLAALHEHYQSLGVPVLGACIAAVAARRLEHATAIPSTSLARLLHRINSGKALPARCVLVLDEAGMVGTRDYHQLLTAVTAVAGKIIPVGDRAQLTEIDAGGMFARLTQTHCRGELTENHRQTNSWERTALLALRRGHAPAALRKYQQHDRLHHHPDPDQVADAIAHDYLTAISHRTPAGEVVAISATRDGATALNTRIRRELQQTGAIGPDQPVAGAAFAVGEQVMITRNDYPRALLNGQRGVITTITGDHVTLRVDGEEQQVPAGWAADRLTPAYAITVHKAQGLTVDIALVDATSLRDANTGYVALSRARHRTEIHHSDISDLVDALSDDPFRRQVRSNQRTDAVVDLTTRLGRSREQRLGIEQRPQWSHDPPARQRRVR